MKKIIIFAVLFLCLSVFVFAQNVEVIFIKGKGTIFSNQFNRNIKAKDKLSLTSTLKFSDKNTVLIGFVDGKSCYFSIEQKNMQPNKSYVMNEIRLPSNVTRTVSVSLCHLFRNKSCDEEINKPLILLPNLKIQLLLDYTLVNNTYQLQYDNENISLQTIGENMLVFDKYIYGNSLPSDIKKMNLIRTNKNNGTFEKVEIMPLWLEKDELKPLLDNIKSLNLKENQVLEIVFNFIDTFYGYIPRDALRRWLQENQ